LASFNNVYIVGFEKLHKEAVDNKVTVTVAHFLAYRLMFVQSMMLFCHQLFAVQLSQL